MIKDSGERKEFSSGAVRDMQGGKGDMVSIPWEAVLRLSKHYEEGAKKYERWNYRKGIPVSSFIDSACRHLAKYQCGMDDEDHLAAVAFNILGAMLMENVMPEMQDLPQREGKNDFSYFSEKRKRKTTPADIAKIVREEVDKYCSDRTCDFCDLCREGGCELFANMHLAKTASAIRSERLFDALDNLLFEFLNFVEKE